MINRFYNQRINQNVILFITTIILSAVNAIRVDWNTNKGPIVPPTSTLPPVPKPPFREPAPVWENQNDIPNPNPYQYVLPPTSRPKLQDDNYKRGPLPNGGEQQKQPTVYGQLIPPSQPQYQNDINYNNNPNNNRIQQSIPSLAIQYVPNVGFQYYAVVPSNSKDSYSYYPSSNSQDVAYEKYKRKNQKKYLYQQNQGKTAYWPQVFYVAPAYQQLPYVQQNQQFKPQNQHNQQQKSTNQHYSSPSTQKVHQQTKTSIPVANNNWKNAQNSISHQGKA